jgi:hypothetical protein
MIFVEGHGWPARQWNDFWDSDVEDHQPGIPFGILQGVVEVPTQPDLAPTKLEWNPAQGGVDFSYRVSGAALTQDTTAQFYWASGKTTDTILELAATPITIPKTAPVEQEQTVHLTLADFPGGPAPGAKDLLAVVDPDNLIQESDEDNNVRSLELRPIAWGNKVSTEFVARVVEIAKDLGTNPNFLMAAMAFESGETFSPSIRNSKSGAVGLIQFLPQTAKQLGTTVASLAAMTAVEQLDYVEQYLSPYTGRLSRLEDVYMAILYLAALGQPANYVLFDASSNDPKIRKAYRQNSGLDLDDDGLITIAEATERVSRELQRGLESNFVSYYFGP